MKNVIVTMFVLAGAFLVGRGADAAILAPTALSDSVHTNESIIVHALLQTEGATVNAAEGTLTYPEELLEVVDIVTASSPLTLWLEAPHVTRPGAIAYAGGIPGGAVVSNAPLFTVYFRPVRRGTATFAFHEPETQVLLNDGTGSAAVLALKELVVVIADPDGELTAVTSLTHPRENVWYRAAGVVFAWDPVPSFFYSVRLSNDPLMLPDDVQEDVDGRISYPALTDGVWYFTLKAKVPQEPWGPVTRRRVQVDATPPEPFAVTVVDDAGERIVSYGTTDATSGIDHYDVRVTKLRFRWLPYLLVGDWETASGSVTIPHGTVYRNVAVRAVDAAGNERVSVFENPDFLTLRSRMFWQIGLTTVVAFALIVFSLLRWVFHIGMKKRK